MTWPGGRSVSWVREIVDEAFRRRAILAMERRIRSIADELADSLFIEGREADLVDGYARILPLSLICELLGLPLADRPRFIACAQTVCVSPARSASCACSGALDR
jgi:cytochrome P450